MIGRSHGIHAEPMTFGVVLAGHLAEVKRGRARLAAARGGDGRGQDRGRRRDLRAPDTGDREARRWGPGLSPETVGDAGRRARSSRRRCSWRHGADGRGDRATGDQRPPLAAHRGGRSRGGFGQGQKGSSAMPHKRNPVAEREPVRARAGRARGADPALENVALWHERDISHSSVERMIAPDATTTLGFMLERAAAARRGPGRVPRAHAERTCDQSAAGSSSAKA